MAEKGQELSGFQASNLNNKNDTNDNNGGPHSSNRDISAIPSSAQRNNVLLPRQSEKWSFRNRAFGNQSSRTKNKQPILKTTKPSKNMCLWKKFRTGMLLPEN